MKRPGLFITFEGGEGAGKTTLIEGMAKELTSRGLTVLKTREPGGTELGEKIRALLLEPGTLLSPYAELALFLASRAQHILEVIRPALEKGAIVLCDRFNDSSIAYQGAGRELGIEPVKQCCTFLSEGLKPHLTFYLDIEPTAGLARTKGRSTEDRIEAENGSFHERVRAAYQEIERQEPERFFRLDASRPPAEVQTQAMGLCHRLILSI